MLRDLSFAEFSARLRKLGFRDEFLGIWYSHRDAPGVTFGASLHVDGSLNHRATIRRLLAGLERFQREN